MVRIPLPLPESFVREIRRVFRGPVVDVIWKLFVIFGGLTFLFLLSMMDPGIFLGFFIATILAVAFSDDIRKIVGDIWHRRFAEIKIPTSLRGWR